MINVVGLHAEKAWRIRAHLQRIISAHHPSFLTPSLSVGPHRVPLQLYGGPHHLLFVYDNIKICFMKTKTKISCYLCFTVFFFFFFLQCPRNDGCGTRQTKRVTEQEEASSSSTSTSTTTRLFFMCPHGPPPSNFLCFSAPPILIYLVPPLLSLDHFLELTT